MTKLARPRAKAYSYLADDSCEDKKAKFTKKCVTNRKLTFENYKNSFEATQLENKINYVEKNKTDTDSIKENYKDFIKNNKSILKTRQRFKNERHNVFTGEINKITFSLNDDKKCNKLIR